MAAYSIHNMFALVRKRPRRVVLAALFAGVLVVAAFSGVSLVSQAREPASLWNVDNANIAILGYDTVAYFTEGRPTRGRSEYEHLWAGARWLFSSAEHRDLFIRDPERYAPQFGAFCSNAMTYGQIATVDPELWTIVDGRLFLNYDEYSHSVFRDNLVRNISKADTHWRKKIEEYADGQAS